MSTKSILGFDSLNRTDIIGLLNSQGDDKVTLYDYAEKVKRLTIGSKVFLRGLIEFSNYCEKDCFYCGIHKSGSVDRFCLSDSDILNAVKFAHLNGFGSIALQSGECSTKGFIMKVDSILRECKRLTNNEIGITLSCGEQSMDVYKRWFDSGADRYLLRIESSSESLYRKIHPDNEKHSFKNRLNALENLKSCGYQVGTGVMIGLPFQTVSDLTDDLLFMKQLDIDMCGMGPYIEHHETVLYDYRNELWPLNERLEMTYKMIAILRILMKNINIAATTALQVIDPLARERAISIGANVIMPNITPKGASNNYTLYDNKPLASYYNIDELSALEERLLASGHTIGYFTQGNSLHYLPPVVKPSSHDIHQE